MSSVVTGNQSAPGASAWLDRFLDCYYRRRPVNATFIGVHDFDGALPDLSENGLGDTQAEMASLLEDADRLPREPLTFAESLDLELACGFLHTQLWEYRSAHGPRGNPALHTGDAIFGVMSLFLSDFAPLAERVESAVARLRAVPAFLTSARAAVPDAPASWTERAVQECDGAAAFLGAGIDILVAEHSLGTTALRRAADLAQAAFLEHRRLLGASSAGSTAGPAAAAGEQALALQLVHSHFLSEGADEIARYAREELVRAAASLDAMPGGEVAAPIPAPDRYPGRYQEVWDEVHAAAIRHRLVTWPDFPIRFRPRPAWSRAAAPHLYFLPYRSPAAFDRPPVHDHWFVPIDASLPTAEQAGLREANDDHVIRLNHVIHHAGIGHHVQNWHAFRSASRIGRIAAVDCASRIAMNCGGTMAEGWACYATDLMARSGFLTDAEGRDELRTRRRMCARAVVDVEFHQGRLSFEHAVAFYRTAAGMPAAAARNEVVKNSMFPGMALMYLAGTDGIARLRAALAARQGDAFSQNVFHDELLSYGSVPVALIARRMQGPTASA